MDLCGVTLVLDDDKHLRAHKTKKFKMAAKAGLEEQVALLQKHFGGIVKMVKDLKISVEALEQKGIPQENEEIREILETQRVIEEVIVANSDAIRRIDKEIEKLSKKETENVNITGEKKDNDITVKSKTKHTANQVMDVGTTTSVDKALNGAIEKDYVDVVRKPRRKKCRYFDRGFCKFTSKCRYIHPENICNSYRSIQKCDQRDCPNRHPKFCKWVKCRQGCFRENCAYLHTEEIENTPCEFKCVGCKSAWEDGKYVIEHVIDNRKTFFCLNCEDWIQLKEKVYEAGWSLFDEDGNLRNNV